ncbi:MAG: BspA family leucine-rich repeat surface protein, partial [Gammaproteobacteria bacterium]|nr:BspA family leucine-rich repeat surface protein [Gammaproteobacteria bacterium]
TRVSSPWTPPRDLSYGDVDWDVTAYDKAGNSRGTSEWDLDIERVTDDISPSVRLISPTDGTTTTNRRPTFQWTGSDGQSGIDYYNIDIDDTGSGQRLYTRVSSPWTPPRDLSYGDVDWDVTAYDKAGNSRGTSEWDLDIERIATNPNLRIRPSDIQIRAKTGNTVEVGENFDIYTTIYNIGTKSSDFFRVRYYYGGSSISNFIDFDTDTNSGINAGGNDYEDSDNKVAAVPGINYVKVCVYNTHSNDPSNNDCAIKSFTVTSIPTHTDLRIRPSDITVNAKNGDAIEVGESFDIGVEIYNIGTKKSGDYNVRYFYGGNSNNNFISFNTSSENNTSAGGFNQGNSSNEIASVVGTNYVKVCVYNTDNNDPSGNDCAIKSFIVDNYHVFSIDDIYSFSEEQKFKTSVYLEMENLASSETEYYRLASNTELEDYQRIERAINLVNHTKNIATGFKLKEIKKAKGYILDAVVSESIDKIKNDSLRKFSQMWVVGVNCVVNQETDDCANFFIDAYTRADAYFNIVDNNRRINSIYMALASVRNSIRKGESFNLSGHYIQEEIEKINDSGLLLKIETRGLANLWNLFGSDYDESLAKEYIRKYQSILSSIDFSTNPQSNKPNKPMLTIAEGFNDITLTPLLKASNFVDIDGDRHMETRWGVRDFNTKIYVYNSGWHTYNKYQQRIPSKILEKNKTYEAVVAFKDDTGDFSNDRFVIFDTNDPNNKPNKPIINTGDNTDNLSLTPIFNASNFSDIDVDDYHSQTWWGIKKDNTYIWQTAWTNANNEINIPANTLKESTNYRILVSYKDNKGAYSSAGYLDFTTTSFGNTPNKPNKPLATDGEYDNKVKITWALDTDVDYYILYICTSSITSACGRAYRRTSDSYHYPNNSNIVYYRIKACNDYGCSEYSDYDTGHKKPTALSPPNNIQYNPGNSNISLSWDSNSDTTYKVYWHTSPNVSESNYLGSQSTSTNSVNIANLTNDTQYYFVVTAIKNGEESAISTKVSTTPTNVIADGSFITTWETTSPEERIHINGLDEFNGETSNYNLDCGADGVAGDRTASDGGDSYCDYTNAGIHTISISGDLLGFHAGRKLKSIIKWGNISWKTMDRIFERTGGFIIEGGAGIPDLSQVKSMKKMFHLSGFNQPINHWDISSVTNMSSMFDETANFNQPLNNWNVSNVIDMGSMFEGATNFNQSLNNWNTEKVTNMKNMFKKATSFNQLLNNWNVASVTDMESMFEEATNFNELINNWNVSNAPIVSYMFRNSGFNQSLNNWNVSKFTDMSDMFYEATQFNQPLNNWNVSNVTDMSYMFESATNFNQPLNDWSVSKVTDMEKMFSKATSFNQPLNNWNVSKVTTLMEIFNGATNFNQPLDKWNVSNTPIVSGMFRNSGFNQPINNWDVAKFINMSCMFCGAVQFNQLLDNWNVSNVTNMDSMFEGAIHFNQSLNNWNVSNVTNMGDMFRGAVDFNQSLSNWNISNVGFLEGMFKGATNFNQPLNNWNTEKVTRMSSMFRNATSFNQLINNWNISKVSSLTNMFKDAVSFNQPLDNWNVSNVASLYGFLEGAKLSTANYDKLLIAWNKLPLIKRGEFHGGNSTYSQLAKSARDNLISSSGHRWTIADGDLTNVAYYNLILSATNGKIQSNPIGIDCGNDCEESYDANTSVELTVASNDGYQFISWSGTNCSGSDTPLTLTMTSDKTCSANFSLIPITPTTYTLSVSTVNGSISSNPSGINCGSECRAAFNENTSVSLSATANSGYEFISWSDSCLGGTNPLIIVMTSDKICSANFALSDIDTDNDGIPNSIDIDDDNDGMPDVWEIANNLNPLLDDANADADGDGVTNLAEYAGGVGSSNPNVDDVKPVFATVPKVTLNATGKKTGFALSVFGILANDVKDGNITPFIQSVNDENPTQSAGKLILESGRHSLVWKAIDMAGNFIIATQIVDVLPIANFAIEQFVPEGQAATVRVLLSGAAPSYPVFIPFSVSGNVDTDDYSVTSPIEITSGQEGSGVVTIKSNADVAEETMTLTMGVLTNAVKGDKDTHNITIVVTNIAPQIESFTVLQDEIKGTSIKPTNQDVTVTAKAFDVNNDPLTYAWSSGDLLNGSNNTTSTSVTFNPMTLGLSKDKSYFLTLTVTDNQNASVKLNVQIRVIAPVIHGNSTDTDGDGILDQNEPGDNDGNGIPDYQEIPHQPNELVTQGDKQMIVPVGSRLLVGTMADDSAKLTINDIQNYRIRNGDSAFQADTYTSNHIYDYKIEGLAKAGEVVSVVIETTPMLANTLLRKYNLSSNSWHSFKTDENNKYYSTIVTTGTSCPVVGSSSWGAENTLQTGANCLLIIIEDGGDNDADTEKNGSIDDSLSLSTPIATPSSGGSSGGGGCVYNPNAPARLDMIFILLTVLSTYYLVRRRRIFAG